MLDLLSWAERFIATASVSRDGNTAVAELAMELLREVGLTPRKDRHELDGTAHWLVIADIPGHVPALAGEGLILLTHLDTVPPGPCEAWTATGGDPFRPTRDGDRLYGLGSADAKVDLVCKAAALATLDLRRLARPIRVVGTFAEEVGLVGARRFAEGGGTRGYRYALVGEPSELAGVRAHKGYAVFEARVPLRAAPRASGGSVCAQRFRGVAAHSSTPHLGENAVEMALSRLANTDVVALVGLEGGGATNVVPDDAQLTVCVAGAGEWARGPISEADADGSAGPIPELPAGVRAGFDPAPLVAFHRAWRELLEDVRAQRDAEFDPDHTVGNLASVRMEGGVCVARFDLRPVPGVDPMHAIEPLAKLADVSLVRHNPALATSLDSALIHHVTAAQKALGLPPRITTKATCTEAGLLSEHGVETLVLGAGVSIGNVHKPNEHTSVAQLATARDLYASIIGRLCMEDV